MTICIKMYYLKILSFRSIIFLNALLKNKKKLILNNKWVPRMVFYIYNYWNAREKKNIYIINKLNQQFVPCIFCRLTFFFSFLKPVLYYVQCI